MMRMLSCLLAVVPALAQAAPPPFALGTLAELRARAKANGQVLVIDFSTDAIEPSRRLLASTWRDQALWQLLDRFALAARVDPEADPAAVQPLALSAYPTIVVFGHDGAEIARVVGYIDAAALRDRLAKAVYALPTNRLAIEKLGDRLRGQGDLDGAIEHYLWLWDHSEERQPPSPDGRGRSLLHKLEQVAKAHAPAMRALEQRYSVACARVVGDGPDQANVSDLVDLAAAVGRPDLLVQALERVPAAVWQREWAAQYMLLNAALPALVAAKRHREASAFVGAPVSFFERCVGRWQGAPPMPDGLRQRLLDGALPVQALVLEAFFGARDERAAALVDRIVQERDTAEVWLMVLKAAKNAGHDAACRDYAARAIRALPEQDRQSVRDLLQRK